MISINDASWRSVLIGTGCAAQKYVCRLQVASEAVTTQARVREHCDVSATLHRLGCRWLAVDWSG